MIIAGFAIDFVIAYGLARLLGVLLVTAAAVGFYAAVCFNYLGFEFWTFASQRSGLSLARFVKTLATALAAFLVRLVLAAIASLLVDYLTLNRVFARAGKRHGSS